MFSRKKVRSRHPFGQRNFMVERLEDRQLMAADVGAYVQGADLHLYDAGATAGGANAVQVSQVSPGVVRVTGIQSQDGGTSLVNGHAYQDFYASGNLFVNFGGGNDTVIVGGDTRMSFNAININVAAPSPVVLGARTTSGIGTVGGSIYSGPDNDIVTLQNFVTQGSVSVNMGVGNDQFTMMNATIGNDITDTFSLNTGAGSDTVNMSFSTAWGNLTVTTYTSLNETDADNVTMLWVATNGTAQVQTGGGSDKLDLTELTAGDDIRLDTGAGDDTMKLNSLRAIDDFFAYLGAGNDNADVQYLRADEATLDGGAGYDVLNKYYDGPVRLLHLSNWEMINGRRIFTVPIDRLTNATLATKV